MNVASCVTRPPLAPNEPIDVTVHLVLNDFGPLGRAYIQTDEAEADEATIIENILSGQYSHPVRVIAFSDANGAIRMWRRLHSPTRMRASSGPCSPATNFTNPNYRYKRPRAKR